MKQNGWTFEQMHADEKEQAKRAEQKVIDEEAEVERLKAEESKKMAERQKGTRRERTEG